MQRSLLKLGTIFHHGLTKGGKTLKIRKLAGSLYFWGFFASPSLMVLFISWPSLMAWFARTFKPIEYPPQSDPKIIKDIYFGRARPGEFQHPIRD